MWGSYVQIGGVFYYVATSGDQSWSGASYNGACLETADQASGARLYRSPDMKGAEGLIINYQPTWPVPSHCSNAFQNVDETGVDCGGYDCAACGPPAHCKNGIRDLDETGIDCGGSCAACEVCGDGIDNNGNGVIDEGCFVSRCYNKIMDGDETGVDCGGSCGACVPSPPGETCGQAVSPGPNMQWSSSINDLGEVLWSQFDPGTNRQQIYSSTRGQLTNDQNDHMNISANNRGDVVWEQMGQIYGILSGQVTQITYNNGYHPSINDSGEAVWYQNDFATNRMQLYSNVRGRLTSDANDHYNPSMNNRGDVVWEQYDPGTGSSQSTAS